MSYLRITNNGYEYFNKDYHLLYSENNMHNLLFEYAAKDLSCLSKFFNQYISQRMDITTFEIKKHSNTANDIKKIKETLISIHPYYEYEYQKVIVKAIGKFFNSLLVFSIANHNRYIPNCTVTKEWYYEKLSQLVPSSLIPNGYYPENFYPENFYHDFQEWMNEKDFDTRDMEETFIINVPRKIPEGFSDEINTHTTICNLLYFILDSSAPNMEKLTTHQRIWLYNQLFNGLYTQEELRIKKNLSFHSLIWYQNQESTQDEKYDQKRSDTFASLRPLTYLNIGQSGIPLSMKDAFESAIEYARTDATANIYEEYIINSLLQLLYVEIQSMIQAKTSIKKCKNCGKYFVITNQKISYCNRFDKHGILCSDIGSKNTFQKKLENDPALENYNRAYKTHFARMKKGKITKKELEEWRLLAKEKLEFVRNGELELETYQKWLKI